VLRCYFRYPTEAEAQADHFLRAVDDLHHLMLLSPAAVGNPRPPLVVLGSFVTTVDGSNTVQFAISAEVREGEIMAMLGASGAGKSTLIDMLSGWI
jgi:ABC-type protease/lipase transport system fused ATPase/permease subunit